MIYLILAIVCSALITILMRVGKQQIGNTMAMFFVNYLVCAAISMGYMGRQPLIPSGEGALFAMGFGVVGGILFLASFAMLQLNIRKNGVVLASIFMKLGVLVPLTMAIVAFHEVPTVFQVLGFLLAVAAILIINLDSGKGAAATSSGLLLLLLIVGGITDSCMNIYDKLGNLAIKDHFLFYIFIASTIISLVVALVQKKGFSRGDVIFGVLIGIPNYYSARFLLLALGSVPAIVTYPVYNVATIVVVSLTGILVFKEQLSRRKGIGIGLILLALALLNL